MDFGQAIRLLKQNKRVARAGWNGKGMFLWLNKGSFDPAPLDGPLGLPSEVAGVSADLFLHGDTGTVTRLPNINMRAADGATVTGWLASQTDMLAEDWVEVE